MRDDPVENGKSKRSALTNILYSFDRDLARSSPFKNPSGAFYIQLLCEEFSPRFIIGYRCLEDINPHPPPPTPPPPPSPHRTAPPSHPPPPPPPPLPTLPPPPPPLLPPARSHPPAPSPPHPPP